MSYTEKCRGCIYEKACNFTTCGIAKNERTAEGSQKIEEYLKHAHAGAKAMSDIECEFRIARALAAFQADPEKEIFTKEFTEELILGLHIKE